MYQVGQSRIPLQEMQRNMSSSARKISKSTVKHTDAMHSSEPDCEGDFTTDSLCTVARLRGSPNQTKPDATTPSDALTASGRRTSVRQQHASRVVYYPDEDACEESEADSSDDDSEWDSESAGEEIELCNPHAAAAVLLQAADNHEMMQRQEALDLQAQVVALQESEQLLRQDLARQSADAVSALIRSSEHLAYERKLHTATSMLTEMIAKAKILLGRRKQFKKQIAVNLTRAEVAVGDKAAGDVVAASAKATVDGLRSRTLSCTAEVAALSSRLQSLEVQDRDALKSPSVLSEAELVSKLADARNRLRAAKQHYIQKRPPGDSRKRAKTEREAAANAVRAFTHAARAPGPHAPMHNSHVPLVGTISHYSPLGQQSYGTMQHPHAHAGTMQLPHAPTQSVAGGWGVQYGMPGLMPLPHAPGQPVAAGWGLPWPQPHSGYTRRAP